MTNIAYWIQRADFSAEDHAPVDVEGAIRAFRGHDWVVENDLLKAREAAGDEFCPPGIGFVAGERILHICPDDQNRAMIHYHFNEDRRVLGLFRRNVAEVMTRDRFPLEKVPELTRRFYRGDHDWLVQEMKSASETH